MLETVKEFYKTLGINDFKAKIVDCSECYNKDDNCHIPEIATNCNGYLPYFTLDHRNALEELLFIKYPDPAIFSINRDRHGNWIYSIDYWVVDTDIDVKINGISDTRNEALLSLIIQLIKEGRLTIEEIKECLNQ